MFSVAVFCVQMDSPQERHTQSHLAVPHPSGSFLFSVEMSCFCHFLNNPIAHCSMVEKQVYGNVIFWRAFMQTLSFLFKVIQSALRQLEILVRQNSLSLSPRLSPPVSPTCLHTSHLLFPLSKPHPSNMERCFCQQGELVMGLFLFMQPQKLTYIFHCGTYTQSRLKQIRARTHHAAHTWSKHSKRIKKKLQHCLLNSLWA